MNNIITEISPLAELLVNAGSLLLKNAQQSEWLDVDQLLQLNKQHSILNEPITTDDVEAGLKKLLAGQDEIYVGSVNVVAMERRVGWDLIFMLRFYRSHTNHPETVQAKLVTEPRLEEVAA